MNNLQTVNNRELLNELRERARNNQINSEKIAEILEEIKWRKGCRLASRDHERDQEIATWDQVESKLSDE